MEEYLLAILDPLAEMSTPAMFGVIILEFVFLWFAKRIKLKKEGIVSILCYFIGSLPYLLFFSALQLKIMNWMYAHTRLMDLGTEWYVWLVGFIIFDFFWWAVHFAAHKVRFLWCIHGVHHTPKEMNMSVAVRGSLFDFIQYIHLMIWMPVFGFHPYMVFTINIASRLYGVLTHMSEEKFKHTEFFDKFLITPSLHRVHHSSNKIYIDTNFSNLFSIWDRIFSTYQPEVYTVKPVFGVLDSELNTENIVSSQFSLLNDLVRDIKSTPRTIDKLKYIFMPPGWAPESGGVTAKDYREEGLRELEVVSR